MNSATNNNANKRDYGDGTIRHIVKKDLWETRLSYGKRGNGTQDRRSQYAKTEAAAKKLLKQMVREKEALLNANAQNTTMTNVFELFLGNKRTKLKENSFLRLRQTVEDDILPEIGFIRLGYLSFSDCKDLIDKYIDGEYSLSTIHKVYDALNACLKWAVKKRDIQYNPMAALDKPTKGCELIKPPKEMQPLTTDECKVFIEEAKRCYSTGKAVYRLGWLFVLMLATGIRIGEALALLWIDVDFVARTMQIQQTTVLAEKKNSKKGARKYSTKVAKRTKTHAGYRLIGLNDTAIEALIELKKITGAFERIAATKTGGLVTHRNILDTFHCVLRKIDLSQRGLHNLRHTFASRLFEKGVDVAIISKLLGHSSVQVTIDTYIHIIEELKRKAVYVIDFLEVDSNKHNDFIKSDVWTGLLQ